MILKDHVTGCRKFSLAITGINNIYYNKYVFEIVLTFYYFAVFLIKKKKQPW